VTALNSPIPISPLPQQRGGPVDGFVDRLSHPTPFHASGAAATLVQCLLSFGMLPLVLSPVRWAEFLDAERHDLFDLTAWWHQRIDAGESAGLEKIVGRFRPRPILMVLPWLAVGFNFAFMITLLIMGDDLGRLWDLTFKHRMYPANFGSGVPLLELESHLYWAWAGTLAVGYLCHCYAIDSHARAVRALVNWTNRLGRQNRFIQVQNDVLKSGLNILWIAIGIGMVCNQAWWAIPMVVAGAFQRRYTVKSSPAMRVALAAQARSAFAVVQSRGDRFCIAGHCGARLPAPAKFCPRCGTAV